MVFPYWWDWELDCDNPHLRKRMLDRGFSETELRAMVEAATAWKPDYVPGRFIIRSVYNGADWTIIVEPDNATQTLIAVTAYRMT